jgi:hypothetical protein
MSLYTLSNKTYSHESLGQNCRFHSSSPSINFQNETHLPFVYTMTHFLHITVIPLWVNWNLGNLISWIEHNTHTHTLHTSLYILHIYLLKSIYTGAIRTVMWLSTLPKKHIVMRAWVKILDSILHHHKRICKIRFPFLLYTPWHTFYNHRFHCGWIEILEV